MEKMSLYSKSEKSNRIPSSPKGPDDMVIINRSEIYDYYGEYSCPNNIDDYFVAAYYRYGNNDLYFKCCNSSTLEPKDHFENHFNLYASMKEVLESFNSGEFKGWPYILVIYKLKKELHDGIMALFLEEKKRYINHNLKNRFDLSDLKDFLKKGWEMPVPPKGFNIPVAFYSNSFDQVTLDWTREPECDFYSAYNKVGYKPLINWPFKEGYKPDTETWNNLGFFFYEGHFTDNAMLDFDDWFDEVKELSVGFEKPLDENLDWHKMWDDCFAPKEAFRKVYKQGVIIDGNTFYLK